MILCKSSEAASVFAWTPLCKSEVSLQWFRHSVIMVNEPVITESPAGLSVCLPACLPVCQGLFVTLMMHQCKMLQDNSTVHYIMIFSFVFYDIMERLMI